MLPLALGDDGLIEEDQTKNDGKWMRMEPDGTLCIYEIGRKLAIRNIV